MTDEPRPSCIPPEWSTPPDDPLVPETAVCPVCHEIVAGSELFVDADGAGICAACRAAEQEAEAVELEAVR